MQQFWWANLLQITLVSRFFNVDTTGNIIASSDKIAASLGTFKST
jgi:hypothetical protein